MPLHSSAAGGGQQAGARRSRSAGRQHHRGRCSPRCLRTLRGRPGLGLALGVGAQVSSAGPGRAPPGSGAVTTHHPPLPLSGAHPSSVKPMLPGTLGGPGDAARGRRGPGPQGLGRGGPWGQSPRSTIRRGASTSTHGDWAPQSRGAPGALYEGLGGRQAQLLPPLRFSMMLLPWTRPPSSASPPAVEPPPWRQTSAWLAGGSTGRKVLQCRRAPGAAWWGRVLGASRVSREPPGTRTNL